MFIELGHNRVLSSQEKDAPEYCRRFSRIEVGMSSRTSDSSRGRDFAKIHGHPDFAKDMRVARVVFCTS
jgi:hypothetical protein